MLQLADRCHWSGPLHLLTKGWTRQELLLRIQWMQEERRKPDKLCEYLMQLAYEVRQIRNLQTKGHTDVNLTLKDFQMKFEGDKDVEQEVDPDFEAKQIAIEKAAWTMRLKEQMEEKGQKFVLKHRVGGPDV